MTETAAAYVVDTPPHTLTVTLPWPDKALSPNARVHRMVKASAAQTARNSAFLRTRNAMLLAGWFLYQPQGEIALRLTFCPATHRRMDLDNRLASCKASLDGIFQALDVDDSAVKSITLRWGDCTPGGAVIVEIEEALR